MRRRLFLALLLVAACQQNESPKIGVDDAWARATGPGQAAAVYASINNDGDEPDRLLSVTTDSAAMAMIHEGRTEDGIARMRMLHSLEIPARSSVQLAPGGHHIMLENLSRPLAAGHQIQLSMKFERSGTIEVPVRVVAAGVR